MISLNKFRRSKNTLVTQASDLASNWQPSISIEVQSHKTNRVVKFVYSTTVKDAENDILLWEYVNNTDKDQPIRKVTIFND